jgi:hypothetical protein
MDFITKIFFKFNRVRYIPDEDPSDPLIIRHYLAFNEEEKDRHLNAQENKKPWNAFIHKICKSDPTDLHDHPWDYFTLILRGGYWEETPNGMFWRGPGYFTFRKAKALHRLIIKDGPCWTFFIHFKKIRDWGFVYRGSWMDHEKYIKAGLNVPWKSVKR